MVIIEYEEDTSVPGGECTRGLAISDEGVINAEKLSMEEGSMSVSKRVGTLFARMKSVGFSILNGFKLKRFDCLVNSILSF